MLTGIALPPVNVLVFSFFSFIIFLAVCEEMRKFLVHAAGVFPKFNLLLSRFNFGRFFYACLSY